MTTYTGTDNLEVMAEAVNYNRFLIDQIAALAAPGDRILDFGAGIGTFALALAGKGHGVDCLEPDAAQAARLTALGLTAHTRLEQLQDRHYDYIYTANVLEHIEDDAGTLAALAGKLRAGGKLLIYVPAFQLLYSSMDRKVGHLRRYRREPLAALAAAAGFTGIRCGYVDSLGFAASLAFRAIGNDTGDINMTALKLYDRVAFPLSRGLDRVTSRWFGKNVLLTATRP